MAMLFVKLKTSFDLGLYNIFRVMHHRLKLKLGWMRCSSVVFENTEEVLFYDKSILETSSVWSSLPINEPFFWGWIEVDLNGCLPDWHENRLSGSRSSSNLLWTKIKDFDVDLGDIKLFWELSRLAWIFPMIGQYLNGNHAAYLKINTWMNHWIQSNPPFYGLNWKCGQEAGIRVLHLAMSSLLLRQYDQTTPRLLQCIKAHLIRIDQTFSYAIAQNNNHATSEAAALWVGGTWLCLNGDMAGESWAKQGRKWLEKLVWRLVEKDGTFSQYSTNYHRVFLDTVAMVELWRRSLTLSVFSKAYMSRVQLATQWLGNIVDHETGEAPNWGANDGAHLCALGFSSYRDFRPIVQLCSILFFNASAYEKEGKFNLKAKAFGLSIPEKKIVLKKTQYHDQGGIAVLHSKKNMLLFRCPVFHYRPSQADVFHVDFWQNGLNVFRDGGSFSYHSTPEEMTYFSGTESHNTVQFDDRDQMPKLSRFLFGDWLKIKSMTPLHETETDISFGASYCDRQGVFHQRNIKLSEKSLVVIDDISGFQKKAVLRWRLEPSVDWVLNQNVLSSKLGSLLIEASMPIVRMKIVQGWESLFYLKKDQIPVLEVVVDKPGQFISIYTWTL